MNARAVADLLSVAREGYVIAVKNGDQSLMRNSLLVTAKAFAHPGAKEFFDGVALALVESPLGNDPTVDDNGAGDGVINGDDAPDEKSDAASPAYEGLVDGDGENFGPVDDGVKKDNSPDVNRAQSLAAVEVAAANWQRLNARFSF